MMADVTITDYSTDPPTVTERDFTSEEIAQREADQAEAELQTAQAAKRAATRAAAIAHAKSLGFTDAMIAVMYPNLVEA